MKTHFMQTYTGRHFYPLAPKVADVDVQDIAHGLAHICRFGGHVRAFYSVAQHSVLVSQHCEPEHALWGLLHDASEAYLGDMIRPLKLHSPQYRRAEKAVMATILAAFGLPAREPASVKLADMILCCTEARDLKGNPEWAAHGPCGTLKERIKPWAPAEAKRRFLARFAELNARKEPKVEHRSGAVTSPVIPVFG